MIRIHHVRGTRSVRVIWLCEELDLDYEVVTVDFSRQARASPEWLKLSPAGKVPAIEDGGFAMFESGAIVEYVLDRYGQGRLRPERGTEERARYLQWCWFAEATLSRPLGAHNLLKPEKQRLRPVPVEATDKVRSCLVVVEGAVRDQEFLVANTFSAADIMMGYTLKLARGWGILDEDFPEVLRYHAGLESRPGWSVAIGA